MKNEELLELVRNELRELFDEAIAARDQSQKVSTKIKEALTRIDELELKILRERK